MVWKKPIFIINFKAYSQAYGTKSEKLAKICEEVSKQYGVTIAIAPNLIELAYLRKIVKIPILSQHVDNVKPGSHTGHITLEMLKENKIDGFLLNHSEKKVLLHDIAEIVRKSKELNLISVVCAVDEKEASAIAIFNPNYVAVEPPELIGTGISISKAKPELITKTVDAVREVNNKVGILVGAGISSGEDVKKAIELGADGILVASAIVKAEDPKKKLEEFVTSI